MKKIAVIGLSTFLVACSTPGEYYSAAVQQETLRTTAQSNYAAAMLQIAGQDPTARVAAIMALALSQKPSGTIQPVTSEALQWASIVVPVAGMAVQGYYGYKLGVTQSDNATTLAVSTNQVFRSMASEINDPTVVNAPAPVIVESGYPVLVPPGETVIVDPVVVQPAPPVIIEQPAPIIVQPANPVIIQPSYPPVVSQEF